MTSYKKVLSNDKDRYDIVLDNTSLIPEPTEVCSLDGIDKFGPVVHDAISYMIRLKSDPSFDADSFQAVELIHKHNGMIKRLREVTA